MYTCALNPSYTDEEFDRLFNDSWNSMSEQFGGDSQEAVRNRHRVRVKRMDQIAAVYKDGYMIAFFSGAVIDSTFKMIFALFGKDLSGSRNFLHDDNFLNAINVTLNPAYDSLIFNPVAGSSIDSYMEEKKEKTKTLIGPLTKDESITENGITYNVNKNSYE
jgi:hypothetical protein